MKFVIFHGAFGSAEGNWYPELKEKLESLGQEVIIPQYPVDDWDKVTQLGLGIDLRNQNLSNWLKLFKKEVLPKIKKDEKLCFIGHSLGPVFILHIVSKFNIKLDSAIFVSPFMDRLNLKEIWQFDHANKTFYKTDFDFDKLKELIPVSYVLYSDSDPYVKKSHTLLFAKTLESSTIMVKRAGHLNSEVNLNEFPLVFDLCVSRLDLDLYQRYLAHVADRYAADFIKNNKERVLYLKPEDIFDEGRFHFTHVKRYGYCNFLTGIPDWNPNNSYYNDARKAAKRIKDFTRVFLVQNLSDLKRSVLIKQIELDLEAGIKVYLCMFNDINYEVKDPDFGMWDKDYLCTIHYGLDKNMKEIILCSKSEEIDKAEKWRDYILEKATRINNSIEDVESFVKMRHL